MLLARNWRWHLRLLLLLLPLLLAWYRAPLLLLSLLRVCLPLCLCRPTCLLLLQLTDKLFQLADSLLHVFSTAWRASCLPSLCPA